MASAVSWLATGAAWCFCSALGSLFSSCCGNDKPSSVTPGAASGRKRSVLLLILAIAVSFVFQYGVPRFIVGIDINNFVTDAWLDGCDEFETDVLIERCAGNSGVYRCTFSALVFYILAAIGVSCKRTANREAWPAKYVLFLFLVVGMCFIPNEPLFLTVYLNVARVGAVLFMILQKILFVDMAHNWNDSWVEKSNKAEAEEPNSGKKWLGALLVSSIFMIVVSIVSWGLLYHFFGKCSINVAFISITIVLCLLVCVAQLSGEEGSLLATGLITFYSTMLCYSAVAKNPDEVCNPFLGEDDILGVVIGVSLTIASLAYAGWSSTADKTLGGAGDDEVEKEVEVTQKASGESTVGGVVANDAAASTEQVKDDETVDGNVANTFSNNWKLNLMLGIVSCWFAMAVTAWGSIKAEGDAANPQVGKVSMWMIIGSQWFGLALYLWTLMAPRLLPGRDFD